MYEKATHGMSGKAIAHRGMETRFVRRSANERTERGAEYAFVLERIASGSVLDVGHVEGTILDIFPEAIGVDQRPSGIPRFSEREVVADITKGLPFPDRSFNTVVCISTLEHIGQGHYGDCEMGRQAVDWAFEEMARVANARLLVTVPLYRSIPDFIHYLTEDDLMRWSQHIRLCELEVHSWPVPIGSNEIQVVAAAMFERPRG